MLVLKRKPHEEIVITNGDDEISIFILKSNDSYVKIGVDAPDEYDTTRSELLEFMEVQE